MYAFIACSCFLLCFSISLGIGYFCRLVAYNSHTALSSLFPPGVWLLPLPHTGLLHSLVQCIVASITHILVMLTDGMLSVMWLLVSFTSVFYSGLNCFVGRAGVILGALD